MIALGDAFIGDVGGMMVFTVGDDVFFSAIEGEFDWGAIFGRWAGFENAAFAF